MVTILNFFGDQLNRLASIIEKGVVDKSSTLRTVLV